MKYFTPELYNLGNSTDESEVDFSEVEWERAIQRYHRRLGTIASALPADVLRFRSKNICLHDAEVLRLGRCEKSLVIVLETEAPACKPVVLTFTLLEEPVIRSEPLTKQSPRGRVFWLYEEWNLDRRKRPTLDVLFSNGSNLKLVFHDFHYLVAEPVSLDANGTAHRPVKTTAQASA